MKGTLDEVFSGIAGAGMLGCAGDGGAGIAFAKDGGYGDGGVARGSHYDDGASGNLGI